MQLIHDWNIWQRSVVAKPISSKMVRQIAHFLFQFFWSLLIYIFIGSGLDSINGVFEESSTYQPSVPSSEAEIIVSKNPEILSNDLFDEAKNKIWHFQITQQSFRGSRGLDEFFIIDNTLGRDVKFSLDDVPGNNNGKVTQIQLMYPNGTEVFHSVEEIGGSYSKKIDFLEVWIIEASNLCQYFALTKSTYIDYRLPQLISNIHSIHIYTCSLVFMNTRSWLKTRLTMC